MDSCGIQNHNVSLSEGNIMSIQTNLREEEATLAPVEAPSAQQIMNQVVGAVRQDSQVAPQAYLDETAVPHGGE